MDTMLTVEGLGKSFKDKKIISNISFEVKKEKSWRCSDRTERGNQRQSAISWVSCIPMKAQSLFRNRSTKDIPRDKIGYLPEERGLYKNVKVMDILLYLAELKDYPLDQAKVRALEYLKSSA